MDNQCPRICPLCGAPVGLFDINFTEKLLMCEDPSCDFPFGYEELQIVTDESQLRDSIEWSGAASLPDVSCNDVSSSSSVVSTTGWADIEQLTRFIESDSCNDSRLSMQNQQAEKRKQKKEYDEEIAKNLDCIKKLNEEINKMKRTDKNRHIEKENFLENLYRFQQTSGRQLLKKEELENLQKRREAELGMGELKININSVPNEMGVINIEICNNDSSLANTATDESIETTENKIQNNIEEEKRENIKQTVTNKNTTKTNQSNKTEEINMDISEQMDTVTINSDSTTMEVITADTMNEENTQNDNLVVGIATNGDTLQGQKVIKQNATAINEMPVLIVDKVQVTPGDEMQLIVVDKVQVLTVVEDMQKFPPITLEELTPNDAVSNPRNKAMNEMQEAMVDEMQVMTMSEEPSAVLERMQVTIIEPQTTVEDKMQITAEDKTQSSAMVEPQNTAVVEAQGTAIMKPKVVAKDKVQATPVSVVEPQPTVQDKMEVTAENKMQSLAIVELQNPAIVEAQTIATMKPKVSAKDKLQATPVPEVEPQTTVQDKMKVTAENKMQGLAIVEPQNPAIVEAQAIATMKPKVAAKDKVQVTSVSVVEPQTTVQNKMKVTAEIKMQGSATVEPQNPAIVEAQATATMKPQVSAKDKVQATVNEIVVTAVVQEKSPAAPLEIQPTLPARSKVQVTPVNQTNKSKFSAKDKVQATPVNEIVVTALVQKKTFATPVVTQPTLPASSKVQVTPVNDINKLKVSEKYKVQTTPVNEITVTAVVNEKSLAAPLEIQPSLPATSVTSTPTVETTLPVPKKKRGRPRKVPKESIDIPDTKTIHTESSKQTEHNIKLNEPNNVSDMNNSVDTERNKVQDNSLDIDKTSIATTSNKDQNDESIEFAPGINTSAECSIEVIPKKRGRKKGQKLKPKVQQAKNNVEVRRSCRLSGHNT